MDGTTCAVSWVVAVGAGVAVEATVAVAVGTGTFVAAGTGGWVAEGATGLATGGCVAAAVAGGTELEGRLQDARKMATTKVVPVNL